MSNIIMASFQSFFPVGFRQTELHIIPVRSLTGINMSVQDSIPELEFRPLVEDKSSTLGHPWMMAFSERGCYWLSFS